MSKSKSDVEVKCPILKSTIDQTSRCFTFLKDEDSVQKIFERALWRSWISSYRNKTLLDTLTRSGDSIARYMDVLLFEEAAQSFYEALQKAGLEDISYSDERPCLKDSRTISYFNLNTNKRATKKLSTYLQGLHPKGITSAKLDNLVRGFLEGNLAREGVSYQIYHDNLDSIVQELERLYGISSCMSHSVSNYYLLTNPYAVYNNTDIGLMILYKDNELAGRVLVHKPTKSYSRIYARRAFISVLGGYLKSQGYRQKSSAFEGTKLNLIKSGENIVVPYWDGHQCFAEQDNHLVLVDPENYRGDYFDGSACGAHLGEEPDCACCGDYLDEDGGIYSVLTSNGVILLCPCCRDSSCDGDLDIVEAWTNGAYKRCSVHNTNVLADRSLTVPALDSKGQVRHYLSNAPGLVLNEQGQYLTEYGLKGEEPPPLVPAKLVEEQPQEVAQEPAKKLVEPDIRGVQSRNAWVDEPIRDAAVGAFVQPAEIQTQWFTIPYDLLLR